MSQAVQLAGAAAILAAFAAAQARLMGVRSWTYLFLNFAGASGLAVSAAYERQWGFVLLESLWAAAAAAGLAARTRAKLADTAAR